jgi:uncharacterized membrane protein
MRLKLKEDPGEWMKFTVVAAVAAGALGVLLWHRQVISETWLRMVLVLLGGALAGCLVRPRWYRPLYRAGMTISFHVGQVMGQVLLAAVFLLVLTPTGLLLRLLGKDLLKMKRNTAASSYWHAARLSDRFDRLF